MICEAFQGVAGADFCSRCQFRRVFHESPRREMMNLVFEERAARAAKPQYATTADLKAAGIEPTALEAAGKRAPSPPVLRVLPGGK